MATRTPYNKIAYGLSEPLVDVKQNPILAKRDPRADDKANIGSEWINTVLNNVFILTSITDNLANWEPLSSGLSVTEFDADSGTASPAGGIIRISGSGITDTSASGNTVVIDTPLTTYVSDAGNATPVSNAITFHGGTGLATSASGSTVTIDFASAVTVPNGGTGDTSFTPYALIAGGTSSTSQLQSLVGVGSAGQILTSNGASALPTFQNAGGGGGTTLAGDVSSATGATVNVVTGFTSGPYANGTIRFVGDGASTLTFTTMDANTNLGIGTNALSSVPGTSAVQNNAYGQNAGTTLGAGATTGTGNCLFGLAAGGNLDQGSQNCAFGNGSLFATGGFYNSVYGYTSGQNLTTTESSNVLINSLGVTSESNALRIGAATGTGDQQLTSAYICGIEGVDLNVAKVVTVASDQLGSATLTAGSGISVTPGAGVITIAATGDVWAIGSGSNYLNFCQAGVTVYTAPYLSVASTTQGDAQFLTPVAGTLNKLYVNVTANTSTTDTTITVFVNSVASALTVTITALTTGVFSDVTHTVSVSSGDLIQWEGAGATIGNVSGTIVMIFS